MEQHKAVLFLEKCTPIEMNGGKALSSFTNPLKINPVQMPGPFWRQFLPPGWQPASWHIDENFEYHVGSLGNPTDIIRVPKDFIFDGASVPLLFRTLIPRAHPNYIQAAALHDWMLESKDYTRLYADSIFHEALGVLGMPKFWRGLMYMAVRIGTIKTHFRKFK